MEIFISRIKELRPYIGKFSLVGVSGIFVNQGCLTILVSIFEVDVSIAGIIAIELSILSNFLLNNFWTWKDKKDSTFFHRLIKYHTVTLISGGVNYLTLLILTTIGFHYFFSNLIGIGLGTIVNFIFNHYWTFRH